MSQTLRVLFVGRSALQSELEKELARGGYSVSIGMAENTSSLESSLQQEWDIAIANFAPGNFGAFEALQLIHQRELDLPTIVVSGRVKDADVAAVLQAGAADHL